MSIDLHIHSTASDGSFGAEAIVAQAVAMGLTALSICDHDSIAANEAAQQAAAGRITYIPGLEISTHHRHQELHILGYFVRPDDPALLAELAHVRRERLARIERTVARLNELGVTLEFGDVEAAAGAQPGHDIALGRPHVAAALVARGVVQAPQQAFEQFLRRGRPAYVDRYRLEPERAIRLIRDAGGLPVLAHPALMRDDGLLANLALQGLGGIEAYHTAHTTADTKRYLKTAEKLGLYVTGGTDSHGPGGSYPIEIGAIDVPDVCAEKLLKWHERQGGSR